MTCQTTMMPWQSNGTCIVTDKETPSGLNKKCKEAHISEADSNEQANLAEAHSQFQLVACLIEVNPEANVDIENERDDLIHQVESYVNVVAHDSEYDKLDSYEWVADLASTVHVMHQRNAFATYGPVPKISITGMGGIKAFVVGMGTVYLNAEYEGNMITLQLNNVLHIPGNQRNLMSIPLWEEPAGRGAHFKDHQVVLTMNKTAQKAGTPIAKGLKINSKLYRIPFKLAPSPDSQSIKDILCFSTTKPSTPWEVWHRRFGHIAYSGLKMLARLDLVEGLEVNPRSPQPDCIACTEAKESEKPYGLASDKATKVGQLTYTDLWGRYEIKSINGNHYFLLLINDASRHVTIKFLKTKTQATQEVKNYITYLKAQGASPCAIKMDQGTEFLNENLQSWCHEQGMELQLTAPYSSPQNGVAERMNRTLVELA